MTQGTPNSIPTARPWGILTELVRNAQLVWRLLKDSRISLPTKLILPSVMGVYLLSPLDLLPDVLPLIGQIDDIAVLLAGTALFIDMCPPDIVQEHRAAIAGQATRYRHDVSAGETVDAEYRVIE